MSTSMSNASDAAVSTVLIGFIVGSLILRENCTPNQKLRSQAVFELLIKSVLWMV